VARSTTLFRSAEQRERPLGTVLRVERDDEDPLPLPEAERAVGDRDLLRTRVEQEREQPLAGPCVQRDDAVEGLFKTLR